MRHSLFLINDFDPNYFVGGTEKATLELIDKLASIGISNIRSIYIHTNKLEFRPRWKSPFNMIQLLIRVLFRITDGLSHMIPFRTGLMLMRVMIEKPSVIIIMNDRHLSLMIIIFLRLIKRKTVTFKYLHDLSGSCLFGTRNIHGKNCEKVCFKCKGKLKLYRFRLSLYDHRIYNSKFTKNIFDAQKVKVNKNVPKVVYPILNYVFKAPEIRHDRTDVLRIGIFGKITPGKGQLNLIKFLLSLNFSKRIVLAGEIFDSEVIEILKSRANVGGIEYIGVVNEIQFCEKVDCVVIYPRNFEGFGRTVVEMSSKGLPVFVSNKGGLSDAILFAREKGGLIFDVDSFEDLETKLKNFLNLDFTFLLQGKTTYDKEIYNLETFAIYISGILYE